MEENQKVSKIVEVFSLYLLECGIVDVQIRIKKLNKGVSIVFITDMLETKYLKELTKIFKIKRQEAVEMYGWELMGQGDLDHELGLVSTLINYFTYYIKEGKVYFNFVRYEI